jgi:hypothetical protein
MMREADAQTRTFGLGGYAAKGESMARTQEQWKHFEDGFVEGYLNGYKNGVLKENTVQTGQSSGNWTDATLKRAMNEVLEEEARARAHDHIIFLKHLI